MRVLITGGAGYIGSLLTARLLASGDEVVVADKLLFGGDAVLPFLGHPGFSFHARDVAESDCDDLLAGVSVVYHLAAIVGFPACLAFGEAATRRINVDATKRVFASAERSGVERFVLASTYSVYGVATDDRPVTEASPLRPQSLYAETKIESERYLLAHAREARCAPIIPRFTTLFGVSPRTRFDLMVNQFVLEALTARRLVIYQGAYRRAFIHVRDIVAALLLFARAPLADVRGEIFNLGNDEANHSKSEIVEIVRSAVPGIEIESRDLSFDGDVRDVAVTSVKIASLLGFRASRTVREGIAEVRDAITSGLIHEPGSPRYRNHPAAVS